MAASVDTGDVKAEINVTPLVDVCLVLLIIFMVVTPMLQKGKAVTLPTTASPDKKPDVEGEITISVDSAKQIWFYTEGGTEPAPVPKETFVNTLAEAYQRSSSKRVVIKADKNLTFGDVKEVMVMLNQAGFESVGLITEKNQGATPGVL